MDSDDILCCVSRSKSLLFELFSTLCFADTFWKLKPPVVRYNTFCYYRYSTCFCLKPKICMQTKKINSPHHGHLSTIKKKKKKKGCKIDMFCTWFRSSFLRSQRSHQYLDIESYVNHPSHHVTASLTVIWSTNP